MEFVVANLFWFVVLVVSAAGLAWLALSGESGITHQDAVILMNREHAVVIDVRDSADYAAGHLPGARNIPLDHIELGGGDLDKLKQKTCLVYCERGSRSAKAQKLLAARGFDKVSVLAGGISNWRDAGLPVEA